MYLGFKEIVDILIQKGANVNHAPNDGNSALILGAESGNLKRPCCTFTFNSNLLLYLGSNGVVEALVEKGADIHHTNRDGYTALIYAAKHGKFE